LGKEFYLDGFLLDELVNPGDSMVLQAREGRKLTGTFQDGNTFDFMLNPYYCSFQFDCDTFHPDAILRLTLAVPEPSARALSACALVLALAISAFARWTYVRVSLA
jgi:hypothetical protein